ncbi:hypothetical protein A2856_00845 [Candidatus Uhrbacteria bacterium RIFCSPHIGHO2_01_FULL_63_20]|uniref:Host attachment protein n=1 Tax=Candidatus Uhrbacteria bacterium RIFCSPHIGHO2_01_FULL_63_20 TaxID=1802385 RepID=A0A1F7TM23_9BACT|nr:MAG: hypothetical protein A2856_00845 [Candidatus Uhrbacteria bacterium RIFCSPHIGHO2_01_FULL_63_20]
MKLPDPIRPFDQATLIVVTDNVQAKLFRADGRNVELVSVMSQKLEPMEQERMAIATGAGMRSGDEHNPGDLKAWTREHLYSELSKELMRRLQNGEFERLAFCAPEEHVEELKECLHVELLKRADAFVPKLLTNDDLQDIVAHVQEEMPSVPAAAIDPHHPPVQRGKNKNKGRTPKMG